jgi:hypothetical protein
MSSKTLLSAPPGVNGTSRPKRLFLGRKRPRSTQFWIQAPSRQELNSSVNRGNPPSSSYSPNCREDVSRKGLTNVGPTRGAGSHNTHAESPFLGLPSQSAGV